MHARKILLTSGVALLISLPAAWLYYVTEVADATVDVALDAKSCVDDPMLYRQLAALPEAQLKPPRSRLYRHTACGTGAPFTDGRWTTYTNCFQRAGGAATVLAFFDDRLRASGWKPDGAISESDGTERYRKTSGSSTYFTATVTTHAEGSHIKIDYELGASGSGGVGYSCW